MGIAADSAGDMEQAVLGDPGCEPCVGSRAVWCGESAHTDTPVIRRLTHSWTLFLRKKRDVRGQLLGGSATAAAPFRRLPPMARNGEHNERKRSHGGPAVGVHDDPVSGPSDVRNERLRFSAPYVLAHARVQSRQSPSSQRALLAPPRSASVRTGGLRSRGRDDLGPHSLVPCRPIAPVCRSSIPGHPY